MGISIHTTVNVLVFPKNFVCPGPLAKDQETRLILIESQLKKVVVVVVVIVVEVFAVGGVVVVDVIIFGH